MARRVWLELILRERRWIGPIVFKMQVEQHAFCITLESEWVRKIRRERAHNAVWIDCRYSKRVGLNNSDHRSGNISRAPAALLLIQSVDGSWTSASDCGLLNALRSLHVPWVSKVHLVKISGLEILINNFQTSPMIDATHVQYSSTGGKKSVKGRKSKNNKKAAVASLQVWTPCN